jgi:KDO2-lipid IV(A) lauroyltransferase
MADWFGRRLGDVAWALLPRRRRIAMTNLGAAFPALPHAVRRRLARHSFQHLGVIVVELCGLVKGPTSRVLDGLVLDGQHLLADVLATHGRALILTAHLGNWEILSLVHKIVGHPLAIVVRPLDMPWLNGLVERLRMDAGVEIIPKQQALRPVLSALKRGRLVAILLDQNTSRREGVFVPFFGRPASTSRSIAALAVRTGTPIVPVFVCREGPARHRVTIHPPVAAAVGLDRAAAIRELTARCTEAIEAAIRDAPEQWLWFHDRWRTRPAADDTTVP